MFVFVFADNVPDPGANVEVEVGVTEDADCGGGAGCAKSTRVAPETMWTVAKVREESWRVNRALSHPITAK